jgi:hypothetical protein
VLTKLLMLLTSLSHTSTHTVMAADLAAALNNKHDKGGTTRVFGLRRQLTGLC